MKKQNNNVKESRIRNNVEKNQSLVHYLHDNILKIQSYLRIWIKF